MNKIISIPPIQYEPGADFMLVTYKGKTKEFNAKLATSNPKKLEKDIAKFLHVANRKGSKLTASQIEEAKCEREQKKLNRAYDRAERVKSFKRGTRRIASWIAFPIVVITLPFTIPLSILIGKREELGIYFLAVYQGL